MHSALLDEGKTKGNEALFLFLSFSLSTGEIKAPFSVSRKAFVITANPSRGRSFDRARASSEEVCINATRNEQRLSFNLNDDSLVTVRDSVWNLVLSNQEEVNNILDQLANLFTSISERSQPSRISA